MGKGTIGKMMGRVKAHAGLTGAIKGHASTDSIVKYAKASEAQQRSMSHILVSGKRPVYEPLGPGASLLKRKRPAEAEGCAEDLEVPEVEAAPVQVPHPVVLAPQAGPVGQQARMGCLPVDIAGMFGGATIHGGVTINIHYGNVASNATNTQLNLSQSPRGSPVAPRVHFD